MKKSLLIILLVLACVLALTACGGETHTHVFDTEEVLIAPTCTENGVKSCYCDCGANQVRKIEATGHTYSEWTLNDDESKLVIACLNCDMIIDSIDNIKGSEGLGFRLNADRKSYSVTGIGICNDTDIVFPSVYNGLPVTIIGNDAFFYCNSLTSIEIPDSVTSIGDSAFSYCDSLTSIVIPDSVTSIGDYAFSHCDSLTSVVIPDSVMSIGKAAFMDCYSLKSINVSENNKNYKSIDGNLYSKDRTTLIQYAIGKTDASFTIPDGVTSIGDYAFLGCDSLTSVVIPDSVTSIGNSPFSSCGSLTSIEIPDNVTSIGYGAFSHCVSLTSIEIPDGVTSIGNSAFEDCNSLTSIEIPDSVTSIGDFAFYYCESLTSIEIPDGVTSIGDFAFFCCYSLKSINVSENNKNYKSTDGNLYSKDGTTLVQYAIGKTDASFTIPDNVTSIGDRAFYYCESITSIEIPDSVTSIGVYAFSSCDSLTSIEIPDNVTSIGDRAFYYCESITSIEIPDSVTSIGDYAFYACDSLTIYCEATSQPRGWDSDWNSSNRPVVWGYTEN